MLDHAMNLIPFVVIAIATLVAVRISLAPARRRAEERQRERWEQRQRERYREHLDARGAPFMFTGMDARSYGKGAASRVDQPSARAHASHISSTYSGYDTSASSCDFGDSSGGDCG